MSGGLDFPLEFENALHVKLATRKLYRRTGGGEWFDLSFAEVKEIIERHKDGKTTSHTYSDVPGNQPNPFTDRNVLVRRAPGFEATWVNKVKPCYKIRADMS